MFGKNISSKGIRGRVSQVDKSCQKREHTEFTELCGSQSPQDGGWLRVSRLHIVAQMEEMDNEINSNIPKADRSGKAKCYKDGCGCGRLCD